MTTPFPRTDLAVEAHRIHAQDARLDGVSLTDREQAGFHHTIVSVLSPDAAEKLCKPIGEYHTVSLEPVLRREETAFSDAVGLLAEILQQLLQKSFSQSAMVVGLGNRSVTPDAVGPLTMESVLATRHLLEQGLPEFSDFRSVSVLSPGVLGCTGIESGELVRAACAACAPEAILAVDALACLETERLCRTVQISNTGIAPGSGVGNHRSALNQETLGVPVIAIGVPTVMDLRLFSDVSDCGGMFVTPRNIDTVVSDFSKLIGYAINLALHPGLTLSELDLLLS